ncbi:hypothetical protein AAW12_23100 [Sphingobacterium sp. Ag1]|nr:hypothetical protein AAW12_23100 [Sphingobacterium sp. Ag1]
MGTKLLFSFDCKNSDHLHFGQNSFVLPEGPDLTARIFRSHAPDIFSWAHCKIQMIQCGYCVYYYFLDRIKVWTCNLEAVFVCILMILPIKAYNTVCVERLSMGANSSTLSFSKGYSLNSEQAAKQQENSRSIAKNLFM